MIVTNSDYVFDFVDTGALREQADRNGHEHDCPCRLTQPQRDL